jgi:hypothetical protein
MENSDQIFVVKQNGEREPFSEQKVLRSMKRVGLDAAIQPQVLEHIKQKLHPEMETSEVFSHIREYLQNHDQQKASLKFNLKQAIFDLGPTGFPFERYMQRIFQEMGYVCDVNLILQGGCVTHEIDVMLMKDNKKEIVEAKFHNMPGVKTDVQVLLYTYARFLDVKETNPDVSSVWVVTNTKLTIDASNYARCKGIKVIGWSYPEQNNLQDFVEKPYLYPITILSTLSKQEKQSLIAGNILLCTDFLKISDSELQDKYFLDQDTIHDTKENVLILTKEDTSHPAPVQQL